MDAGSASRLRTAAAFLAISASLVPKTPLTATMAVSPGSRTLASDASMAAARVRHPLTRLHLEDLVVRVDALLEMDNAN